MKNTLLVLFIGITLISCNHQSKDYLKLEGMIFGTYYHIIYEPVKDDDFLDSGIMEVLNKVDWSLSTYKDTSTINKFNYSEGGAEVDSMMKLVYMKGDEVFKHTQGAFDMTVGPLVNAWGFGFKKKDSITSQLIDSLLLNVGMEKVKLENEYLSKTNSATMLDASAIAKGFGVDMAAVYLEENGIQNYMVEIGGEIRVKGISNSGKKWRVGIDKPIDDRAAINRQIQDIISISNISLATSGNYRNFYIRNGKKYAHTIDPHTGYPVQHSLLSASIIAPDCMTADAYATACMVMGLEKSMQLISALPDTEGYFIYVDEKGENQVKFTGGFKDLIIK